MVEKCTQLSMPLLDNMETFVYPRNLVKILLELTPGTIVIKKHCRYMGVKFSDIQLSEIQIL